MKKRRAQNIAPLVLIVSFLLTVSGRTLRRQRINGKSRETSGEF